ncbi:hypothetical protein P0136_07395 [Lentisphaerota bacterium ZTH]|nr:hypothetical protein JYG24_01490 [Lentisphaerota bacterium]WET05193.1 hypothetical protein P0136_07395 [Lentisphaerota bacterium ZTH]
MRIIFCFLLAISTPCLLNAGDYNQPSRKKQHNYKLLRMLPTVSDAEKAKLQKLYQTDPEAFRKEIHRLVKAYKEQRKLESKRLKELIIKYHKASNNAEKQQYYNQIYAMTRKTFDLQMLRYKKRLEALEMQLSNLTANYEKRRRNADKIIKARVDHLTRNRNHDWDSD